MLCIPVGSTVMSLPRGAYPPGYPLASIIYTSFLFQTNAHFAHFQMYTGRLISKGMLLIPRNHRCLHMSFTIYLPWAKTRDFAYPSSKRPPGSGNLVCWKCRLVRNHIQGHVADIAKLVLPDYFCSTVMVFVEYWNPGLEIGESYQLSLLLSGQTAEFVCR